MRYRRVIALCMVFLGAAIVTDGSPAVQYLIARYHLDPHLGDVWGVLVSFCGVLALFDPRTSAYGILTLPLLFYIGSIAVYAIDAGTGTTGIVTGSTLYLIVLVEMFEGKPLWKPRQPRR